MLTGSKPIVLFGLDLDIDSLVARHKSCQENVAIGEEKKESCKQGATTVQKEYYRFAIKLGWGRISQLIVVFLLRDSLHEHPDWDAYEGLIYSKAGYWIDRIYFFF